MEEKKKFRGYAAYHDFVNSEEFGEFRRGIVNYVVNDWDSCREFLETMELHEGVLMPPVNEDLLKDALEKRMKVIFYTTTSEGGVTMVNVGCCHPDHRIVTYGG